MNIPRATQFAALELHKMPPTFHITIPADIVGSWSPVWIRFAVSRLNSIHTTNLKCHRNKDNSFVIWHNPDPKTSQNKSAAFDKLIWLRGQLEEYRRRKLADPNPNSFLNEMFAIQEQIESVLIELEYKEGQPRNHKGNAIHQPLPVILEFYGLTEEIWSKIPPKIQRLKKIQAEVAIKNRRREMEPSQ